MKIATAFLVVAPCVFLLSMNLPARFGRASDWVYFSSIVCLATGLVWGVAKGPTSFRIAIALYATGLALLVVAMMFAPRTTGGPGLKPLIYVPTMIPTVAIAAAAFLVLAVIQWARAMHTELSPE